MEALETIYRQLFAHYGDLDWWPARTPYEVMVGAVLTQNTAWSNVEKAIARLGADLCADRVLHMPMAELQDRIRPAGFYRQKAQYLKALSEWFSAYDCDVARVQAQPLGDVREELLRIRGVGNETADSILLYAFHFPTFVVDAYTVRLFNRYPVPAGRAYREVKAYIEGRLPADTLLYNRFHALIVQNAKEHCKVKPRCTGCPLENVCRKPGFAAPALLTTSDTSENLAPAVQCY